MEVTFKCRDGTIKCSKRALVASDYFFDQIDWTSSQMEFDFEECSVEGIKTYLDYVHMLDVPPLSVTLLLDVLKFLHFQERFDFVENFLQ